MEYLYRLLQETEGGDHVHDDEHEHMDGSKPWGKVIAAAVIVQLVTFSGIREYLLDLGIGI